MKRLEMTGMQYTLAAHLMGEDYARDLRRFINLFKFTCARRYKTRNCRRATRRRRIERRRR